MSQIPNLSSEPRAPQAYPRSAARPRATVAFVLRVVVLFAAATVLAGCGENYPELAKLQAERVTIVVRNLGSEIAARRIRNANLIEQYAQAVARDRPELSELTAELAKEGTTEGLAYKSLLRRLSAVNLDPKDEKEAEISLDELSRIEAAADPEVFNDSLIDVVNVLADLSNGKLARLYVPDSEPKPKEGPGSYLVGNPRYGEWRRDSSGNSFWAFYGQYALMRDLFFFPRRYSYGDWYTRRGWSYYGDVGRQYYGTRADSARWDRAAKTYRNVKPRKSYGPVRSERRLSTYGRAGARGRGSAVRRASTYASSVRGSAASRGFRGK